MKRLRRLTGACIAAALAGLMASTSAAADWPPWFERWLFNSGERTERAIESFEQGDAAAAVEPLEIALRLSGEHPEAQYNTGAARLGAGQDDAQSLLEAAAEAGTGELASLARYNLGNARLAGSDFAGAIEAYEQVLRQDPAFQDAKYNLELARRQLEEQQKQEQQEQEQEQEQQQEQQQNTQQEQQPQQQEQPRPEPQDPQPQDEPRDGEPEQQEQQEQQESPLPQFRDLPDMSAEEAAAILEAIENMEREQRRRDALDAASQHRSGDKDW